MTGRTYDEQHRILAEMWCCNVVQWTVLLLLESKPGQQIEYDDRDYHALTGQPGETLRSMVRRGWIDGPTPKEKPRARPWSLNDAGRELLRKVKAGLRPPEKMTDYQKAALLRFGKGMSLLGLRSDAVTRLIQWGYAYGPDEPMERIGKLTPLGQEAYRVLVTYLEGQDE